jgi:hypothetical protein
MAYSIMPVSYDPGSTGSWGSSGNPYGGVPQTVSPQASQNNAIAGNLGNISSLYSLASGAGGASGMGAAANLNAVLPGGTTALGGGLNFANQEISGQLPQDVLTQIEQAGAERGVSTGMPGSPNSNAAMLRALGLTSLGLSQQGVKDLSTVIGSTPTGPQFNPQSQLIDPNAQLEQENYNSSLRAAPNPAAAAAANLGALYSGRGAAGGGAPAPTSAADNFWQTNTPATYPAMDFSGFVQPNQNVPQSSQQTYPQTDPNTGLPLNPDTGEIDWENLYGNQSNEGDYEQEPAYADYSE